MVSSSRAADSSSHRSKRSDEEQGKEEISSLPGKLTQLKKQIQASRLVSVKEKIEKNRKSLQLHTCHLFDLAAEAEAATRSSLRQSAAADNMLSARMGRPLSCLGGWDWTNGLGEKEIGHIQEENLTSGCLVFGSGSSNKSMVPLVKFPSVNKIPPYTTWMFLDNCLDSAPASIGLETERGFRSWENQRMADDQSVVGRRRIYYDPDDNEALICSDSDEEIPEQEEERHEFSEGEDQMLWKALQDHGLCQEALNILCQFIDATPLEIEERFGKLAEKNEKQANNSTTCDDVVCEGPVVLDKTLDAALDSFDNLFCRRCLVFDCRLHGCSQNLVMPNEKQPFVFEPDEMRKPCGDQCYLKRRKGYLDVCHDSSDCNAREGTKLKTVTEEPDTATPSESEDSNPNDDSVQVQNTVPMQIGTDEDRQVTFSSGTAEASRTPNAGATSRTEIIGLEIHEKTVGKRKIIEHESISEGEPEPTEPFQVSADKKQKKLTSSDVPLADENILHGNPISKADAKDQDSRQHSLNHFQEEAVDTFTEHPSKADNCFGNNSNAMEDVKDTDIVSTAKDSFSSSKAPTASCWNTFEEDLYLKGIEIFGKNSCLIARNLLSGLKTCLEVSNYMFNNGGAMLTRPLLMQSSLDDFGKADQEYMGQEIPIRTRIFRRRGKSRRLKYTWKSAGHPTMWKRIADGKRQWCKQYTPCSCQMMCGKECSCMQNGTCCEKYCGCSKSCKNRFRGCHCAKSQCRSRQCPCFAAGRECDPDVCRNCWVSCGDGSLGEPPSRGDGYQCGNMKLLLKQRQRILLARSAVAGWGAFIKNPVNKNDYLGEYTGELISHKEADKRGKIYDRANSSFLFDLNDQCVLDAYRKGDKLKFANHSSNPNCYAKVMLVAGDHRVGIFAKEHIEASEELFYDYRYGPDQAPAWARKPEGSKRDDSVVSHSRAHKVA